MWINMDEYAGKGESCLDSIAKHKLWYCWRWFATNESVVQVSEREWMNMWMNMDKYAEKGESRNYWSSEVEQQARTGKGENSKY